jgi:plastocyanin
MVLCNILYEEDVMNRSALLALATASAGVLAACGGGPATSITVTTTDYKYTPNAWRVAAGKPIKISVRNDAAQEHEFVIMKKGTKATIPFDDDDEDNVLWETEAAAATTKNDEFVVAEPGVYQIVCGLSNHLEQGMEGTLTAE